MTRDEQINFPGYNILQAQHFEQEEYFTAIALKLIGQRIHSNNREVGWWDKERNVGEMLMLAVSELAEGMEGHRKNLLDDHLPERPMLEVELADCIIRVLDMAEGLGLDVGGALVEKLAYNKTRLDHKREARLAPGGKAY